MVMINRATSFDGKRYEEGNQYQLPESVEERWIRNGIAERVEAAQAFQQDKSPQRVKGEESPPEIPNGIVPKRRKGRKGE